MLIGTMLIIALALGVVLLQELKRQKECQRYLHSCYEHAHSMGALSFDDQGCVFCEEETEIKNEDKTA